MLSLYVSSVSVIISIFIALPFGILLGLYNFKLKAIFDMIIFTFMGIPPVLVGLIVFIVFSSSGILGQMNILYTPTAMLIAQIVLIIPIVTGLTMNAVKEKGKKAYETAFTLGANKFQMIFLLIKEIRISIITAIVAGFGRAFSEVGAVMIVGGNIKRHTRVMTTSIVMETSMGNYGKAITLGILLLGIFLIINGVLYKLQHVKTKKI